MTHLKVTIHITDQVKGSAQYWKRERGNLIAMIHQLGCPTAFLTLTGERHDQNAPNKKLTTTST